MINRSKWTRGSHLYLQSRVCVYAQSVMLDGWVQRCLSVLRRMIRADFIRARNCPEHFLTAWSASIVTPSAQSMLRSNKSYAANKVEHVEKVEVFRNTLNMGKWKLIVILSIWVLIKSLHNKYNIRFTTQPRKSSARNAPIIHCPYRQP